jgi:hypothetical protein
MPRLRAVRCAGRRAYNVHSATGFTLCQSRVRAIAQQPMRTQPRLVRTRRHDFGHASSADYQQPLKLRASKEWRPRGGSARAFTSPIAAVRLSSFGFRGTARPPSTQKPVTQNSGYARSSRFTSLMAASTDGASYSLYARVPVRLEISTTIVMAFTPDANYSRSPGKSVNPYRWPPEGSHPQFPVANRRMSRSAPLVCSGIPAAICMRPHNITAILQEHVLSSDQQALPNSLMRHQHG